MVTEATINNIHNQTFTMHGETVTGGDIYRTTSQCLWAGVGRGEFDKSMRDAKTIISRRFHARGASRGALLAAIDFIRSNQVGA